MSFSDEKRMYLQTEGKFNLLLAAALFHPATRDFLKNKLIFINEFIFTCSDTYKKLINAIINATGKRRQSLENILGIYLPDSTADIFAILDLFDEITESCDDIDTVNSYKEVILDKIQNFCISKYYVEYYQEKSITKKVFLDKMNAISSITLINKFEDPNLAHAIRIDTVTDQSLLETMGSVVKTGFPEIDNSCAEGGLVRGQLGVILGSPGKGKTIFTLNLINNIIDNTINKDLKVLCFFAGDMNNYNLTTRNMGIALNMSQPHVKNSMYLSQNLATAKSQSKLFDPYRVSWQWLSPGKFTAKELLHFIKTTDYLDTGKKMIDYFDVFWLDYDSNLAGGETDEINKGLDMYIAGGETYNMFKDIADYVSPIDGLQKLVVINSQPKVQKEESEHKPLNMNDISESSKKQRIIDFMFTITVPDDWHYPNAIGILSCVKARNSDPFRKYYFRDLSGRYYMIEKRTAHAILELNKYHHATVGMPRITQINELLKNNPAQYLNLTSLDLENKINAVKATVANTYNGSFGE